MKNEYCAAYEELDKPFEPIEEPSGEWPEYEIERAVRALIERNK